MEKLENVCVSTENVLKTVGRTWDDVIATTFVYIPEKKDDNEVITRGLNLQLFGHVLIIVPNTNEPSTYHMYTTKNSIDRNHIINDLIGRGYSVVQVAKMMKCSTGTVNHVLGMSKSE